VTSTSPPAPDSRGVPEKAASDDALETASGSAAPASQTGWRRPVTWIAGAALLLWTALLVALTWPQSGLSWHFFPAGATALFGSSGLHLYADNPGYQIGPLTFVVARALALLGDANALTAAKVLMTAAGPLCIALLAPVVPPPLRGRRLWLAAFAVMPGWVVLSVRWGHLDDVLAMVLLVLTLRSVLRRRAVWAGAFLALAAASKPWAIDAAPLLLGLDRRTWKHAYGTLVAGVALAWGPFVLAAPSTLQAMTPSVLMAPGSGLWALGVRDHIVPAWDRTVAFVAAIGVALVAQLRGRWAGVLVAALAVRIALDPQDNAYYLGGLVIAAAVYDLLGTRARIPWLTLVTTAVFWQPFTADYANRLTTTSGWVHWWWANPEAVGYLHLAWCVAVVVLVLAGPRPPTVTPVIPDPQSE
jgi:hypothetical protein